MLPPVPPSIAAHEAVFLRPEIPMSTSSHPIVTDFADLLDENLREAWEERAAVMQFEAGIPRDLAEALALLLVIRQYPTAALARLHTTN